MVWLSLWKSVFQSIFNWVLTFRPFEVLFDIYIESNTHNAQSQWVSLFVYAITLEILCKHNGKCLWTRQNFCFLCKHRFRFVFVRLSVAIGDFDVENLGKWVEFFFREDLNTWFPFHFDKIHEFIDYWNYLSTMSL